MNKKIFNLLGIILIVFICFETLISPILQIRSQVLGANELVNRFNIAMGAIGHSDLTPLPNEPDEVGSAIALIKIPKIGIEQIVFEGNSSDITQKGIGHMSGSSGIAEPGISILVGRRMTWGAPFSKLPQLKLGDKITTTTIAGTMNYKVIKINASIEDLKIKESKSVLGLVTSTPMGLAYKDYIVLAKAEKAPYISTPQNRYDGYGFRQGEFNILILFYLIIIVGIMLFYKRFLEMFEKSIVISTIFPTLLLFVILFVKELDKAMPPTL